MAVAKYRGPTLRPSGPGESGPDEERSAPLLEELRLLWQHRDLLLQFAVNDLRHRYFGSSIGAFWMVVNPIVELVTYTFVFHVLMGVNFRPSGGVTQYSLFLFTGMVSWFAMAEGLQRAATSITDHAHLIKKVHFPAAVLPGHVVLSAVFNQVVRTVILALGVILLGNGLSWHFVLVPVVTVLQMLFVMGIGFFLATANVYFRDTGHWVNAILLAWMFVTPIFYPHSAYPEQFKLLLQFNPLAHFVGVYHELILNQRMPHIHQMVALPLFGGLSLAMGYSVFAHHRKRFADLA